MGWLETVLYSECRHKKETELRISSLKLKGLLLSHSAVSVTAMANFKLLFILPGDQFSQIFAERLINWTKPLVQIN